MATKTNTNRKRGLLVHRADGLPLDSEQGQALEHLLGLLRGRATTWTHGAVDVIDSAANAEERLQKSGVARSLRPGATMTVRPAGPGAKAYRYAVTSCCYTLSRVARGWTLLTYDLESRYPASAGESCVHLTVRQAEAVYRTALGRWGLVAPAPEQHLRAAPARGSALPAASMLETPMPDETEEVSS